MLMKRTIFGLATILVVFLTVLAVLAVRPLRTVKAHHGCSDRTLMGNYGWTEFGYEPEDTPTPNFWTSIALVHFDGNGNFTGGEGYSVDNGSPDADNGTTSITDGTYTVNSDCTIKITYTWGSTYHDHGVVVGPDGSEVIADEYGPDSGSDMTTGHVNMKKVSDSDWRRGLLSRGPHNIS
jgi:hypothetical protein